MVGVLRESAQAFTEYTVPSLFVKYLVLPQTSFAMSKPNQGVVHNVGIWELCTPSTPTLFPPNKG